MTAAGAQKPQSTTPKPIVLDPSQLDQVKA